jgi:hypothetical protein
MAESGEVKSKDCKDASAATTRAMVQAVDESKTVPTVLVTIYNGLIDHVAADRPCRVVILENDKYLNRRDYKGEDFVLWDNEPTFFGRGRSRRQRLTLACRQRFNRPRIAPGASAAVTLSLEEITASRKTPSPNSAKSAPETTTCW